ncbi:MAG TPA: SGNH/GDSL hydrolase family protein [Tepidisphaeraceae bacterium]|nr:SGNH/GDSL hydrolase family protein [Tepidisphaeraceae bacterium]
MADFNAASGITLNGSNVSAWADAVGGYSVAQATGGLQPAFTAHAYAGNPGVTYNGTTGQTLTNITANLVASGARTVMAFVLPGANNANGGTVCMFRTSAEGISAQLGFGGLHRVSLASSSLVMPEMDATIPVIGEWLWDSSVNLAANLYGTPQPLNTVVQDPDSGRAGFQIGNTQTWTDAPLIGTVLRLFVYNRDLSAAELSQNRAYLTSIYNPHVAGVLQNRDYWESPTYGYPITLGSQSTAAPGCQAVLHLRVPLGVSSVAIALSTNLIAQGADPSVGVFVDGALNTHWTPTADNDVETFTLTLDGQPHLVQIWGSYQTTPLANAVPAGTFIQSIPSNVSVVAPATGGRGVLIYGDSIPAGFGASITPTKSWPSLLRQSLLASGGRVALEAFGGRTLGMDANVAVSTPVNILSIPVLVAKLVALLSPYSRRQLWWEMGFNDYVKGMTVANFQTTLGTVLDQIHASDPTISAILQGFTINSFEATPNSNGDLPSAFRTAMSTVAGARSSFCTYHDYSTVAPIGDFPGGVHPNDTGCALIAAQALIDIGP